MRVIVGHCSSRGTDIRNIGRCFRSCARPINATENPAARQEFSAVCGLVIEKYTGLKTPLKISALTDRARSSSG
jgi:hypothetical protein